MLLADLDRFKHVNDAHGHRVGDDLLVAVAERLSGLVRPGDTLARMSGDEFVIVCEDLAHPAQAEALAVRIAAALAEPFHLTSTRLLMTASVGIAFAGQGTDIPGQLLRDADAAMYRAKRRGGAGHDVIDLGETERLAHRASLARDLEGASSRGELCMVYQPIVTAADGHLAGAEALLRWAHPVHGLLGADTVVPLVEEGGILMETGRWGLGTACRDRRRWERDCGSLPISVNVSAIEMMGPDFCDVVAIVLRDNRTDPTMLTLEMTEDVLMANSDRALLVLGDLKAIGVKLALDDFGSGYSSLDHLKRFPIDTLKLDRVLIAELGRDKASSAIISTVIQLAHLLDMTVVAEGVETRVQQRALADLGCDFVQGFAFAAPVSSDELGGLLGDLTRDHRAPQIAVVQEPGVSGAGLSVRLAR